MSVRRLLLSLILVSVSSILVEGSKRDGGYGYGGDNNNPVQASSVSSPTATSTPAATATGGNGTSVQGDRQCPGSQLMCVTATVTGSTITYELLSTGSQPLGWMAIGFGDQMANSPMVIMWPNQDGTITLSQREAPSEVMPTPVSSPPNVATVATPLSTPTGSQIKLTFTIPGSATNQKLIWAYGTTRPDPASDSKLLQHLESGPFGLDLTKTLSIGDNAVPVPSGSNHISLLGYQKTIVAHAIIVTFGFILLLPAGILLARYTRTISSRWFFGHWVLQAGIAGPFIIAGCVLGYLAVYQQGRSISSPHKTLGSVLLGLYVMQCCIGAFIHYVKIPWRGRRPPQNYIHAILGLTIIGLALYQVRLGYTEEWPNATGRGSLGQGVNILWIVWVIVLCVLYFGGLAYLPRQWRQEAKSKHSRQSEEHRLTSYRDIPEASREDSHEDMAKEQERYS